MGAGVATGPGANLVGRIAAADGERVGIWRRGVTGPEPDILEGAALVAVNGGGAAVVGGLGAADDVNDITAAGAVMALRGRGFLIGHNGIIK